jgi:hypothetical protein
VTPGPTPPVCPLFASVPDSNHPRVHLQVDPHELRRHLFKLSVSMSFKNRRRWDALDGFREMVTNWILEPIPWLVVAAEVQSSRSDSEHRPRWIPQRKVRKV